MLYMLIVIAVVLFAMMMRRMQEDSNDSTLNSAELNEAIDKAMLDKTITSTVNQNGADRSALSLASAKGSRENAKSTEGEYRTIPMVILDKSITESPDGRPKQPPVRSSPQTVNDTLQLGSISPLPSIHSSPAAAATAEELGSQDQMKTANANDIGPSTEANKPMAEGSDHLTPPTAMEDGGRSTTLDSGQTTAVSSAPEVSAAESGSLANDRTATIQGSPAISEFGSTHPGQNVDTNDKDLRTASGPEMQGDKPSVADDLKTSESVPQPIGSHTITSTTNCDSRSKESQSATKDGTTDHNQQDCANERPSVEFGTADPHPKSPLAAASASVDTEREAQNETKGKETTADLVSNKLETGQIEEDDEDKEDEDHSLASETFKKISQSPATVDPDSDVRTAKTESFKSAAATTSTTAELISQRMTDDNSIKEAITDVIPKKISSTEMGSPAVVSDSCTMTQKIKAADTDEQTADLISEEKGGTAEVRMPSEDTNPAQMESGNGENDTEIQTARLMDNADNVKVAEPAVDEANHAEGDKEPRTSDDQQSPMQHTESIPQDSIGNLESLIRKPNVGFEEDIIRTSRTDNNSSSSSSKAGNKKSNDQTESTFEMQTAKEWMETAPGTGQELQTAKEDDETCRTEWTDGLDWSNRGTEKSRPNTSMTPSTSDAETANTNETDSTPKMFKDGTSQSPYMAKRKYGTSSDFVPFAPKLLALHEKLQTAIDNKDDQQKTERSELLAMDEETIAAMGHDRNGATIGDGLRTAQTSQRDPITASIDNSMKTAILDEREAQSEDSILHKIDLPPDIIDLIRYGQDKEASRESPVEVDTVNGDDRIKLDDCSAKEQRNRPVEGNPISIRSDNDLAQGNGSTAMEDPKSLDMFDMPVSDNRDPKELTEERNRLMEMRNRRIICDRMKTADEISEREEDSDSDTDKKSKKDYTADRTNV